VLLNVAVFPLSWPAASPEIGEDQEAKRREIEKKLKNPDRHAVPRAHTNLLPPPRNDIASISPAAAPF